MLSPFFFYVFLSIYGTIYLLFIIYLSEWGVWVVISLIQTNNNCCWRIEWIITGLIINSHPHNIILSLREIWLLIVNLDLMSWVFNIFKIGFAICVFLVNMCMYGLVMLHVIYPKKIVLGQPSLQNNNEYFLDIKMNILLSQT